MLGVSPNEDMKGGNRGILYSLTMQRANFSSLVYLLEDLDELVGMQLKALERPSTPSPIPRH